MLYKCKYCDEKGEKSINTLENDYVKVGTAYAHSKCHKIALTTRKKKRFTEEDAILEIARLEEITKLANVENEYKFKLFELMAELYRCPVPNGFFVKIDTVVKGKYKGISNPITYLELHEMYSNGKMINKLNKLAHSMNIKDGDDRYHWDLGVMVKEYPKYVKAKLKSVALREESKEALENIAKYKTNKNDRYKQDREEVEIKNENSISVNDITDDLFNF